MVLAIDDVLNDYVALGNCHPRCEFVTQNEGTTPREKPLKEKPPLPPLDFHPRISADLSALCLRCLEKDPKDRFAKVENLRDALCPSAKRSRPSQFRPAYRSAAGVVVAIAACLALWTAGKHALQKTPTATHAKTAPGFSPILRPDYGGGLFSDRDESAAATTEIAYENLGDQKEIHSFTYTINTNYELRYEYCGTVFRLHQAGLSGDIREYQAITFSAKSIGAGGLDYIQLVTNDDKRHEVTATNFGFITDEWQQFHIPFASFKQLAKADRPSMHRIAFIFSPPNGTVQLRNVRLVKRQAMTAHAPTSTNTLH